MLQTTLTAQAEWLLNYHSYQLTTTATLRSIQSKLAEIVSVKDFGAKGDGTTDDSVAFQNWINYLLSNGAGGAGIVPRGTYKIGTPLTIDLSISYQHGIKIVGDGQFTSILDMTSITTGPGLFITSKPDGIGEGLYSSICDIAFKGNVAGSLVRIGVTDDTAAVNALEMRNIWVGNGSTSSAAVGIELNYVLGCVFSNVTSNCNGHGYGWKICAAAFCTWVGGGAGYGDYGMLTVLSDNSQFGTVSGNLFIGMDFECNTQGNVSITNPNTFNNMWMGGTFVYNPTTMCCVNAPVGSYNTFSNQYLDVQPSGSGTPTYSNYFKAGSQGVALFGVMGLMVGNAPSNPMWSMGISANQNLTTQTWTKIGFNTIGFQNGSGLSTSTNRYTAGVPGVHHVKASIMVNTGTSGTAPHSVAIYKNGTLYRQSTMAVTSGTNTFSIAIDALVPMSVNDYVEIWGYLSGDTSAPQVWTTSFFDGSFKSI